MPGSQKVVLLIADVTERSLFTTQAIRRRESGNGPDVVLVSLADDKRVYACLDLGAALAEAKEQLSEALSS